MNLGAELRRLGERTAAREVLRRGYALAAESGATRLAERARDEGLPVPACVAALSPWTDLAATGASIRENDGRSGASPGTGICVFTRFTDAVSLQPSTGQK
jgi:hypothetical protein